MAYSTRESERGKSMSDKKIVWNRKTKIVVLMVIAVVYLAGIFIWGIFMNPEKYAVNYANKFLSPSLKHPFGTDFVGRDMFYRCVKGLSNSIVIGILASIVVPCIKPAIMTVATLVFLWSWNNYLLPLITLNKQAVYTLPLMISNISVSYRQDYGAQMLALALSTFPVLIIFILGSKYFVKGITAGAVKG